MALTDTSLLMSASWQQATNQVGLKLQNNLGLPRLELRLFLIHLFLEDHIQNRERLGLAAGWQPTSLKRTEVLCQVDNLHVLRNIVLLQERFALAMTEAEEDDIHLVERHLGGKLQVGLAIQSLVNLSHQVAGVTLAVGEYNLCLRI